MRFAYLVAYEHGKKVMKDGEVVKNGSLDLSAVLGDAGREGYEYMDKIEVGEQQFMLVQH